MSNRTPTDAGKVPPMQSMSADSVPTVAAPVDAIPTYAAPTNAGAVDGQAQLAEAKMPTLVVAVGFLVLALSFMVNAMDRAVFAPLLPAIRHEYGFSLQTGGLLATGFTLGMAIAGVPAGYLVDRFSRKSVLLVSIVIYSLGTLATPLASGFADMATYRIVSGFGEGMQAAALFAAVGAFFHHRRGLALGGVGVAFGLGVILGPLVGVRFAADFGTWRAPFIIFGLSGLGVALIVAFTVSRRVTERGMTQRAVGATSSTGSYDHMPAKPYNRNSIALAVAATVGGVVLYGFLGLYPSFLVSQLGLTTAQSALALSFVGFGGLAGLLGGWIGDRIDQRNLLIGSFLAMSVTGILIFQVQASLGWQCLFAFLMGVFGTGFMFPNVNSAIQRAVRPNQVGRAAGLFVTSYYGPAAFSGLLLGALVAGLGWRQAGLWQITVLPLVAVAALAFVRTSQFNNAVRRPAH
jgi:MFS family permease